MTHQPHESPGLPVPAPAAALRPGARFLLSHPAHFIALGCGSGLSPVAPGTMGTLWAWACFAMLSLYLTHPQLGWLIAASALVSWWACTVTARHLGTSDPGAIVCDEVLAFWCVLWMIAPAGLAVQLGALVLFRFFDAVKPGPVGWADRVFHGQGYLAGWGVLFDDLVAAFCTLLLIAAWRWMF